MGKKHIYVGMDVHKETTVIVLAHGGRNGKVEPLGSFSSGLDSMRKVLERLRRREARLHFAYESGPTGFALQRRLEAWGEECIVASASHVPKKAGDRVKTDRRDAELIARAHRAGELDPIHVPDAVDESIRDVCRARFDAKQDERRGKQRLKSLLLRNGYAYKAISGWTPAHKAYLREKPLQHPGQKAALESYVRSIDHANERIEDLETQLELLALEWRLDPLACSLMAFKGIGWLTGVRLAAELGDLRRFPSARALMGYLGLAASEHSSGLRERKGAITKAGNAHARFYLVESAAHYRKAPKVSKELTRRQVGIASAVVDLSWRAQNRLHKRYWTLVSRGLAAQKAQVAVARELAGYVWAVGQNDYLYEDLPAS